MSEQNEFNEYWGDDNDILEKHLKLAAAEAKKRKEQKAHDAAMERYKAELAALGPRPNIRQLVALKKKYRESGELPNLW